MAFAHQNERAVRKWQGLWHFLVISALPNLSPAMCGSRSGPPRKAAHPGSHRLRWMEGASVPVAGGGLIRREWICMLVKLPGPWQIKRSGRESEAAFSLSGQTTALDGVGSPVENIGHQLVGCRLSLAVLAILEPSRIDILGLKLRTALSREGACAHLSWRTVSVW